MTSRFGDNLPVVAATTVATILIASQIDSISRPVATVLSRAYLHYFVLAGRLSKRNDDNGSSIVVTELYTHPVKSLRSVECTVAVVGDRGFVGDRRFMLVVPAPRPAWGDFGPKDATHRFITQRQCPCLARIVARLSDGDDDGTTLTLSSDLIPNESCTVSTQPANVDRPVYRSTLWGSIVSVQDLGDEAATYVQKIVSQDTSNDAGSNEGVRLVMQCPDDGRTVKDKYVPASARSLTGSNPSVNLADGFPLLIGSEASLADLNHRLEAKNKEPLPMARFRPNIVINGIEAFAEDRMKVIKIGTSIFHVIAGCPRCKQSCTDQMLGTVTDEPVETLREFRALSDDYPDNVYFCVNVVPAPGSIGCQIRVGDSVEVLKWGEPTWSEG